MTRKICCAVALALAVSLALAGCGDGPVFYKQGTYSGKADSNPWENERFKGDPTEWEKTVKARTQQQNEYSRTVATRSR